MTEWEQFHAFMAQHVARFADIAKQWTSRLSERDREWLLERALEIAWREHRAFDPRRRSLVLWFEDCVRRAASRRKHWRVWTISGYEWVPAKHLRRWP